MAITIDMTKAIISTAKNDFKKELRTMSTLNASGGPYSMTAKEIAECRKRLNAQARILLQLDIDPDEIIRQGNYLVDAGCWH